MPNARPDVLIVVDFQDYWTNKNPETTQRIKDNIDQIRSKGVDVVWVYALENPDETRQFVPQPPIRSGDQPLKDIFRNSARFLYDPAMMPAKQDFVIGKGPGQTDAFSNPHLLEFLKDRGNIHVAGFMQGYCVFDTAMSGARAGLPVSVMTDFSADENDAPDGGGGDFDKAGINTVPAQNVFGLTR